VNKPNHPVFGIVGNPDKTRVWEILPKLLQWFSDREQEVYLEKELGPAVTEEMTHAYPVDSNELVNHANLILALGGDGTILYTARLIEDRQIPILGIRLGGLGFLAEVYLDEIYDRMHRLIDGKYTVEKRMTIAADVVVDGKQRHLVALNDFVINKARPLRMINIRVMVDGAYLNTYSADGLIISSPTGSTAYNLAVNGPIIVPTLDAMVINPISPHSLTARPVVIPANSEVQIEPGNDQEGLMLSADGQIELDLTPNSVLRISKGEYPINLVVWKERTFYDVLRRKLQWGSDPRNQV